MFVHLADISLQFSVYCEYTNNVPNLFLENNSCIVLFKWNIKKKTLINFSTYICIVHVIIFGFAFFT